MDEICHPLVYARQQLDLSQEEFAREIRAAAGRRGIRSGCRRSRIYKWETGRAVPDPEESQPLIADALGVDYAQVAHLGWPHWLPGHDAPLLIGPHNAVPALREALMSLLDRRSFLSYSTTTLVTLAEQWSVTEPGRGRQMTAVAGDVDTDLLAYLETAGAELIRLAPERSTYTKRLMFEHLTAVTEYIHARRYDRHQGRRLHTLAASMSQAIAWQQFDERRHTSASRYWQAALHNAHTAGDRDQGAGILSDLAYQLLWLKDPKAAAALLEHVIPRTQHPAARSLLHLRHARALAVLDEGAACRRSLKSAERELGSVATTPAPAWCTWMSHADLAADSGRCLADLGDRRQAHRLMDTGLTLLPTTRAKTRAVFMTYQAEAYLGDGEIERAADTAAQSLTLVGRINAPRCITMIKELESGFSPHAHTEPVAALLEHLHAAS